MKQPSSRGRSGRWGVPASLCCGLAWVFGCSDGDRLVAANPEAAPDAPSAEPDPVSMPAPVPAASETPASVTPPTATPTRDCPGDVEFVALGEVPENYGHNWVALDPHSTYAYWSYDWSGNDVRISSYRWSARDGIEVVTPEAPPDAEDVDVFVRLVSSDGSTVLGPRFTYDVAATGFRWTREAGQSPLDFDPAAMTSDARIAVGLRGQAPVRWIEGVGTEEIDPTWSGLQPPGLSMILSADGGIVLATGTSSGRSFRWSALTGSTELPRLERAPSRLDASYMSHDGAVIAGTAGSTFLEVTRAIRWTEATGLQDLGDLPGAPAGASAWVAGISADGSTIIGQVTFEGSYAHAFRWTEATGMQDLSPDEPNAQVNYVSPNGAVVIGYHLNEVGTAISGFRWTQATGPVEVGYATPQGIGADGDLLVGNTLEGTFIATFGALAGSQPPIFRHAPPGLLPSGWSEPRLEGVSNDGRLLVGEARNPAGQREPWLMHLREQCPEQ